MEELAIFFLLGSLDLKSLHNPVAYVAKVHVQHGRPLQLTSLNNLICKSTCNFMQPISCDQRIIMLDPSVVLGCHPCGAASWMWPRLGKNVHRLLVCAK